MKIVLDHAEFFAAADALQKRAWTMCKGEPPALLALTTLLKEAGSPEAVSPDDLRHAVAGFYDELTTSLEQMSDADEDGMSIHLADVCALFPELGRPLAMMVRSALPADADVKWNTRAGLVPLDRGDEAR